MNIGIDIDGVLTNYQENVINYGSKFCCEENLILNIDNTKYWEVEAFHWTDEQAEQFWNRYLVKYFKECDVRMFASDIIKKLRNEGNKIIIITARNGIGMPQEYYGKEQEITKEWLKKKGIEYDKIIFQKEKLQPCIDNNIDVMIEDSPKNIEELSKQIKTIKFDCEYNRNVNNDNVITAYSWHHIYKIISELS